MKLNKGLIALAMGAAITFSSCSKDDANGFMPNDNVLKSFKKQFPNAQNVSWNQKKGYDVASFTLPAKTKTVKQMNEAWYKPDGNCSLTEIEIDDFSMLPEAVQEGFLATEVDGLKWTVNEIDDIDLLYRVNMDPVYKIEVEKDSHEDYDLLFSEDGMLISAKIDNDDDDDDNEPVEIPHAILDFISVNFADAKILDLDYEGNEIEVEIYSKKTEMELYFEKKTNHFIRFEVEIEENDLPQEIKTVLSNDFASWDINDVFYVTFADKSVQYKIEMEDGSSDKESTLWFLPSGEMVK